MKYLSSLILLLGSFPQFLKKSDEIIPLKHQETDMYNIQLSLHVIECKRRRLEEIYSVADIGAVTL